ncbi:MAG: serine protease [Planctomycetaceae bacterium]|nr:serine protease [Planctomycetaceae bacterium]
MNNHQHVVSVAAIIAALLGAAATTSAQSVCLPAPRLLTTMPMGGQLGSEVEVTITGQTIEDLEQLLFSHPGITAKPKLGTDGNPEPNKFMVTIASDCPPGIHEARVMSRLGVSSSRVFTVGTLVEVKQDQPATTVATAMPLQVNSICNATLPLRAVNHYSFEAKKSQRIIVDCAAKGIDSKMNPVLIIADAEGRDLVVERRGGALDFTVPDDGTYVIKVHELTFKGGAEYFYRLVVQEVAADAPLSRLPSVRSVSSFSWPPADFSRSASTPETEPNNKHAQAQKISLPCDITGSFFPAADVDTFEFVAKKGDVWWVEVASERLGRPTDASIIVQHVSVEGSDEKLTDVVELSDILSPVKRSSNGYAYDGPPYNAGSADILGKVEIKEDGVHRLQLSDLFGGTRNDPRNEYCLIVRKAAPDFALVAWALHMELRNGDRNALSKPIALRGGSTMAFEVVAVRRDGFDGEIELSMEDLPTGVTAVGLKIPAGQSRGIMLLTAQQDAPRGMHIAKFSGRAMVDGVEVIRPCQMASMAWPVTNAWSEIPAPRLLADIPVSVGGSEFAAISIAATESKVWEATAGATLQVPLKHILREDFSGATMGLKAFGTGFDRTPKFDVSLKADQSEAVFNLGTLKTVPGDYLIAFYGSAVTKYRYNPEAVTAAEFAHKRAQQEAADVAKEAERLAQDATAASGDQKTEAEKAIQAVAEKKKAADAAVAAAAKRLQDAKKLAQPKDIVDIIVSEPIAIRIKPAETK